MTTALTMLTGGLLLLVGFVFHFIGQLISVLNWDVAARWGLQEKNMPAEYKTYEQAIALADVCLAWLYGVAGVGLLIGAPWGFQLAWIPGAILTYHSLSFRFWTLRQRQAGYQGMSPAAQIAWFLANLTTGLLAMWVAWRGP